MPYGYLGQNTPNQTVSNSGVFSISDVASLEKQGKFGGSLELITESTFSGVSYVDFTEIQENKYDVHCIQFTNIQHSTGSTTRIQLYESGVLETASVYQYAYQAMATVAGFQEGKSTGNTIIYITYNNNGANTGDNENGYIYFYNLGNSSKYSFLTYQSSFWDNGEIRNAFGGGVLPQASLVDGIRLDFGSVNSSGTIKLYGVKQL